MRTPRTGLAKKIARWKLLAGNLAPWLSSFPYMAKLHARLQANIARAEELAVRQEVLRGKLQEVYQELDALAAETDELRGRMRKALISELGPRSERLSEFGFTPFTPRGPSREEPGAGA